METTKQIKYTWLLLTTPPVTTFFIPPTLCHSRLLDLQCFSPLEEDKDKKFLRSLSWKVGDGNVEDGITHGDSSHKNLWKIALTAWDQMIT
jgi:hypothetical protein